MASLGNRGSKCNTTPATRVAPSARRAVDWTDVEAVGRNDVVVTTVVVRADIGAVGGNDAVVVGSDGEDEVACSTSIGGAGGNGTLNSGFRGFFKASKHL
uniref:Uncharacterized protein n=1 Tax=Romanomermis culicivorax TaxID=13658 RepID=A0A915INA5_ROMCU